MVLSIIQHAAVRLHVSANHVAWTPVLAICDCDGEGDNIRDQLCSADRPSGACHEPLNH